MKKKWHSRKFTAFVDLVEFVNDRKFAPGDFILGPVDGVGDYQIMYFAEQS